jgi:hypothetical protein
MSPSPPRKKATRLAGRDAKTKKIDGETLADSAAAVNRKRTKPKDESIEFAFRRKLIMDWEDQHSIGEQLPTRVPDTKPKRGPLSAPSHRFIRGSPHKEGGQAVSDDLLVLTRVIDASDPYWDQNATIIGTMEQINAIVDLSEGVPYGWRLLRGKKARRFLKRSMKAESRWQREQAAKQATGGLN